MQRNSNNIPIAPPHAAPTPPHPVAPRPELAAIPAVPHGGHRSTLPPGDLLDFSANINPFGPSPRIWEAMQRVAIAQHPDPRATPLRHALAEHNRVRPDMLLVGNGAVDLIYQTAVAFLRPGERVLVVVPTFGEYAAAAAVMGATTVPHHLEVSATGFVLNRERLLADIARLKPRMLVLCNPNNPTGTYLERETVAHIQRACHGTLLLLDEAFVRFVEPARPPWAAPELLAGGNLLILRSMTKDYALTGLRVGYALAAPATIAALEKVQPPWSVNALAQAAALAALADEAHLRTTLAALADARALLLHDLARRGFAPLPSAVHFFLLPVEERGATAWHAWLLNHGMLLRDATSFGLPGMLRIGVRRSEENSRLAAALTQCKEALCPHGS